VNVICHCCEGFYARRAFVGRIVWCFANGQAECLKKAAPYVREGSNISSLRDAIGKTSTEVPLHRAS